MVVVMTPDVNMIGGIRYDMRSALACGVSARATRARRHDAVLAMECGNGPPL
jgi:hypothetical protein